MADFPDPESFLAEPNVAILATAGKSGRPHAVPIWYLYEDGEIVMSTGPESTKARNIAANPNVTLVVDRRTLPYYAVMVHGRAEIGPPLNDDQRLRMATRYLGEERGRRYFDSRGDQGSVGIRLKPSRFVEYQGRAGRRET